MSIFDSAALVAVIESAVRKAVCEAMAQQRPAPRANENARQPLLTTEQAARHVGMKRNSLEALRTRGNGPRFLRLGRAIRYRLADLEAWTSANERRSTSDPGQRRSKRA